MSARYKDRMSLCFTVMAISFISTAAYSVKTNLPKTIHCEYYNGTVCDPSDPACKTVEECLVPEIDKRNHCFAVWVNDSAGVPLVILKGCFIDNKDCYDQRECVEKREEPKKEHLFCCCEGDMCNHNFTWNPIPIPPPTIETAIPTTSVYTYLAAYTSIFILILSTLALGYWYWRHRKMRQFNQVPANDPHSKIVPSTSPLLGIRPIQLIEMKARGRFGAVWKAQYKNETVAVKIFPIQDKASWLAEQEIFRLPMMNNPDILRFIGVEKRGDNLHAEFWLVSAFHERGSLCDYLKANLITWQQLVTLAESMSRGLMFLHEDIPGNKLEGSKPAVAHRDFKSKNVLIKADMTACIADFGLALVFQPNKPCGDTHGQVGTRRYMAPEVLEGAIHFSRDAFLRIDMYACGLVLWELATRCRSQPGPVSEYMLPFEKEVGQHPSLEDMQECVVNKKQRPVLLDTWRQHPGLLALCDTMEECWDHDAEARLSASCVLERVAMQSRLLLSLSDKESAL